MTAMSSLCLQMLATISFRTSTTTKPLRSMPSTIASTVSASGFTRLAPVMRMTHMSSTTTEKGIGLLAACLGLLELTGVSSLIP